MNAPTPKDGAPAMTAEKAAKMVKRTIIVKDGDAQREKQVPVAADEVLAFRQRNDGGVVVVTTDGQKLASPVKQAAEAA